MTPRITAHQPAHSASTPAIVLATALFALPADARILFDDVTESAGIDDTGETWGTSVGDINGDGCPDVWIDHHQYTPTVILRNRCNGSMAFEQLIEEPETPDGSDVLTPYNIITDTHGVGFGDYDGDGDQDMIEVSGASYYNLFWVNDGVGNFTDSDRALGFIWPIDTNSPPICTSLTRCRPTGRRSPLWFDYDFDGILDVMITARGNYSSYDEPTATFKQTIDPATGERRFDYDGSTGINYLSVDFCAYAVMAEVTGDDLLDVFCADESRLTKVWDLSQGLPFVTVGADRLGPGIFNAYPYDLAVADFNGDGRNDIAAPVGVYGTLVLDRVDTRTLHYMHRKDASDHAGFSFSAQGDITVEFDWWTLPEDIRLGANAIVPPWSTNLRIHDGVGHRVILNLSSANPAHVGAPSYIPGVSRGIYIWFDGERWQVRTSNIRFSFDYVGMVVQAARAIPDVRAEVGLATLGQPNARTPLLFIQDENGRFVDLTDQMISGGGPSSCVSAVAADFNNDGHVDLMEACSDQLKNRPNRVYINDGAGNLSLVPGAGSDPALGYSGAGGQMPFGRAQTLMTADFDLDGLLDVFVTNGHPQRPYSTAGRQQIMQNRSDSGNHWAQIDLEGVESNRDAIGARLFFTTVENTPNGPVERTQLREQGNGMHKYAQNFKRIHVGLGQHDTFDLRILWPNGADETHEGLVANQFYTCVEHGGCSATFAPPCGMPTFSSASESAVFVWQSCTDPQLWSVRVTAGGRATSYRGRVDSDNGFLRLVGVSQEASDVLTPAPFSGGAPGPIDYVQNVGATGFDGFDVQVAPGSEVCFAPTAPTDRPVYIGSDRTAVSTPINLRTFTACTP